MIKKKKNLNSFKILFFKYHKLTNYKNKLININSNFFIRIRQNDLYNGRLWILKYQHWFIFIIFFFKSLKKFQKKKNLSLKFITNFYFLKNKKKIIFINLLFNSFFFLKFTNSTTNHFNNVNFFLFFNYWINWYKIQSNLDNSNYLEIKQLQINSFIQSYNFFKKSHFINFFIKNQIDVPICFKKIKSLKKIIKTSIISKFINYLIKKGLKEKTNIFFFSEFFHFFNYFKSLNLKFNWFFFLSFIINFYRYNLNFIENNFFVYKNNLMLNFNNFINNQNKIKNETFFWKNLLQIKLTKLKPLFHYFIYKIDKNIRKYARRKTGKYKFIWKYIPQYKRMTYVFKLLTKDISFNYNKKFKKRISNFFFYYFLKQNLLFFENQKIIPIIIFLKILKTNCY